MRILMVSHGYPPTISGVTLVVQKLARAMASRGHQVCVITSSDTREPYETEDQGVRVVRVRAAPNPFWEEGPIPIPTLGCLEEIAEEYTPDIIHSHDSGILGIQARRLGQEKGIPILASCHYVPRFVARYLSFTGEAPKAIEAIVWDYAIWFYRRYEHVVFATESHRREFVEAGLDVATSIISNGVNLTRYRPIPAYQGEEKQIADRYSLPSGKRILFVGRLAKDKEIDVLIEAMRIVRRACDAHLVIVGRGDYYEHLKGLAEELGLQNYCHFLGFVPEEDMPALYRAMDLFAIAATTEVQSLPTLQACATALPVVAADAMALPELVHNGVNGYLIRPGDIQGFGEAIARILCDESLCRKMGAESLRIVQPHDEQRTFDAYEALYAKLVQQKITSRAVA